jgi:hypothetical protein
MGAKIMIKKAEGAQLLDLTSDVSSIGRSEDNTVVLDDAACSRHHAQIRLESGRYALVDLGSLNGTLVNGEQVTGSRDLRDGDVVTIGTTNLIFSLSPEQATQAFAAAGAQPQPFAASTPQPQPHGAPRVVQPQKPPTGPVREPALAGAASGRATAKVAAAPAAAARPKAKGSKKTLILILLAVLVVLLVACAGGIFLAFSQGWLSFV